MKKTILMLVVSLLMSAMVASAAETKTPEQHAKSSTEKLVKQLSLTTEQADAVLKLNMTRWQAKVAEDGTEKANDKEKKKADKTFEEGLTKLLTADQLKTYNEQKAQKKDKK